MPSKISPSPLSAALRRGSPLPGHGGWSLLVAAIALTLLAGCQATTPGEEPAGADPRAGQEEASTLQASTLQANAVLPIVAQAIDFHGGALYEASETSLTVTSRSGSFDLESRVEGDRFRHAVESEMRRGGEGEETVRRRVEITNDAVRQWLDGEEVAVPEGDAQGLRDFVMARVYFPFLPYRLGDPGVVQEDLGLETWDGRELHKVKVTFAPGSSTDAQDVYLYWFDPETGRLEQLAYSFETGRGGVRFRKAKNHRRVGGLLFTDQENRGADGPGYSVDQLTPAFVAGELEPISTVELTGIEVRPLD